jgi:hypothetical protein
MRNLVTARLVSRPAPRLTAKSLGLRREMGLALGSDLGMGPDLGSDLEMGVVKGRAGGSKVAGFGGLSGSKAPDPVPPCGVTVIDRAMPLPSPAKAATTAGRNGFAGRDSGSILRREKPNPRGGSVGNEPAVAIRLKRGSKLISGVVHRHGGRPAYDLASAVGGFVHAWNVCAEMVKATPASRRHRREQPVGRAYQGRGCPQRCGSDQRNCPKYR